jgi:hypothetical protein
MISRCTQALRDRFFRQLKAAVPDLQLNWLLDRRLIEDPCPIIPGHDADRFIEQTRPDHLDGLRMQHRPS